MGADPERAPMRTGYTDNLMRPLSNAEVRQQEEEQRREKERLAEERKRQEEERKANEEFQRKQELERRSMEQRKEAERQAAQRRKAKQEAEELEWRRKRGEDVSSLGSANRPRLATPEEVMATAQLSAAAPVVP